MQYSRDYKQKYNNFMTQLKRGVSHNTCTMYNIYCTYCFNFCVKAIPNFYYIF